MGIQGIQFAWCRCQACHQSISCWLTATLQKPYVILSHPSRRRSSCIQLSPCKASQTAVKLSYLWHKLELKLSPRSVTVFVCLVVCLFVCVVIGLFAWLSNCSCMRAVDLLLHVLLHLFTASTHSLLHLIIHECIHTCMHS